ncbi:prepilin-type N-terminal cleavage/methylation domain-containing protein [Candidatus Parcubacteria bacterium]|nr:prepilin-type N-terminal cleavage/methylation domain-containing protein [Patescibacteria group bacterium]MBU4466912.1 prepilin-type N-terminal cleavage/methylation domain-containing protein [Patescibacteria group bacterium]MCG2688474.1 prepilin-type N-terminal cleavage/methylation domain-containing protein [Candidatus Parcubacteria bacterium]
MNLTKKAKKKGFTLIELLVVIAVIGLLASIVLVSMGGARKKARDSKRQADIRQIGTAMELYYSDAEAYLSTAAGANTVTVIGTYMLKVPTDPTNSGSYLYTWIANAADLQKYCVYVLLEGGSYLAGSEAGVFTRAAVPSGLGAGCR